MAVSRRRRGAEGSIDILVLSCVAVLIAVLALPLVTITAKPDVTMTPYVSGHAVASQELQE